MLMQVRLSHAVVVDILRRLMVSKHSDSRGEFGLGE